MVTNYWEVVANCYIAVSTMASHYPRPSKDHPMSAYDESSKDRSFKRAFEESVLQFQIS